MRPLVLALALIPSVALAGPTRLTYRYLHVGRALGQYDVTTYSLELDGDKVSLGITKGVTDPKTAPDETGPYLPTKPEVYNGTATATKDGYELAFDLAHDQPFERLSCRWKRVDVAAGDAVRIKTPGEHAECGDKGVFSPAKTTRMRALMCGADGEFVFGPQPGLERAALSEECYIQGAGLRAIGADHAIRRVSPKR